MIDPIKAHITECHFCGKRIKLLHKYIELEWPAHTFIYLAHLPCYGIYLFIDTKPRGFPRWGKEKV